MRLEHNYYKTVIGNMDFEFIFVELGNIGWRAYIINDINFKAVSHLRSDSITVVHRLWETDYHLKNKIYDYIDSIRLRSVKRDNLWYICWSEKINSLEDMREIAKSWAEITAYYIKNGGSFESIQPLLKSRRIISF